MSGKQFFTNRYLKLGWEYKKIKLQQAIRINTANVSNTSDLVKRMLARGISLEKISFLKTGYWVIRSKFSVGATSEYLLGLYSIQEAAAQIPATVFTELGCSQVLDACAAPGGKTVQMADLMRNTGIITALDIDRKRLIALSNHLERCHVQNTMVYKLDAQRASRLNTSFDRILLDMPCSGNSASDQNWFRRRTLKDVERNAALQRDILTASVKVLKDNGEIVYSTCSIEPEEDELNIDWAVRALNLRTEKIICYGHEGLTDIFGKQLDDSVKNSKRIWPERTQGFFVCKLKRGR